MKITLKTGSMGFNNQGTGIFDRGSNFDVYKSGIAVGSAKTKEEAEKKVASWVADGAGIHFNAFTKAKFNEFLESLDLDVYFAENDTVKIDYTEALLITFRANDVKGLYSQYLRSVHNYQHGVDGRY